MTALHLVLVALALHWVAQTSNSTAGLRGLTVVSHNVAWASGTKGTVLRTLDGGEHWNILNIPGTDALDFRDIVAFDAKNAVVLASGTGAASRVYLTTNAVDWSLVLAVPNEPVFFDAVKFWDRRHGILLGDPVAGRFTIYTTADGGLTWVRSTGPIALPAEGAFAASGTCLTLSGNREAWFGTGGPGGGRVFHTSNKGQTWTVANTPLSGPTPSAGIFSLRFLDPKSGFAAGGDYQKPSDASHAFAVTKDGGQTWTPPGQGSVTGYRSALTYLRSHKLLIAVGTNGSDYSPDSGITWTRFSSDNLNSVASDGDTVWAIGPKGLILKLAHHQ